jgi:peptidoglycan/LPS O-acetylase OafA/YrhL
MRNQWQNFFSIDLSNRIFGLDILRFASIFFVLYGHAYQYVSTVINGDQYVSFIPVNDGVSIFFVLSGFLIGKILLKLFFEKGISIKGISNFWIRRWFRTLPAYFATIAILIGLSSLFHVSNTGFSWKYLVFLQNFKSPMLPFFVESWSLSVEEWFYLSVPIALLAVNYLPIKDKKIAFLGVILLFLILPIIYRIRRSLMLDSLNPADLDLFHKQVLTRIDSIVYGVLGIFIKYFYPNFWTKIKYKALIVCILIHLGLRFFTHFHPFGFYAQAISSSVESLSIILVFPFFDSIKTGKGVFFKIITWISIISYSLYLLNLSVVSGFVMPLVSKSVGQMPILMYSLYFLINIVFAYLLYIFCERPMMQAREKFSKQDNL